MFSYYFDVLIFKIILKNKIIYIILIHFSTKNTLKNNRITILNTPLIYKNTIHVPSCYVVNL